jgi:hypothetical protein
VRCRCQAAPALAEYRWDVVSARGRAELLAFANALVRHHRLSNVRFLASPCPTALPEDLPNFDFITLSAVYEHLLPHEREEVMPRIWAALSPGGVIFINQTPHRYFPIELHSTGLPFINYLPDRLAHGGCKKDLPLSRV